MKIVSHVRHSRALTRISWSLTLLVGIVAATHSQSQSIVAVTTARSDSGLRVSYLCVSADGRKIAFVSHPRLFGLGQGVKTGLMHADLETGEVKLLEPHQETSSGRAFPSMSANGRFVISVGGGRGGQVRLFDTQTNTSELISASASGTPANRESQAADISADGRFVVFETLANNIVAGDSDIRGDIYLADRQTGQRTWISRSTIPNARRGFSSNPFISDDGQFISFQSSGTFVAGDTLLGGIYLLNRQTGLFSRMNQRLDGQSLSAGSGGVVSPNGRYVLLYGRNMALVGTPSNLQTGVFLRDLQLQTITYIGDYFTEDYREVFTADSTHIILDNTQGREPSQPAGKLTFRISDGLISPLPGIPVGVSSSALRAVFSTTQTLSTDDRNTLTDLYTGAIPNGPFTRALTPTGTVLSHEVPPFISVSDDGSVAAWANESRQVQDWDVHPNLFLAAVRSLDQVLPTPFNPNVPQPGSDQPGLQWVEVSGDGRWAVAGGHGYLTLRNLQTGQERQLAVHYDSGQNVGGGHSPRISRDGRFVAFVSAGSNIVAGRPEPIARVYLHDQLLDKTILISHPTDPASFTVGGGPSGVGMDRDGTLVSFIERVANQGNSRRVTYHIPTGIRRELSEGEPFSLRHYPLILSSPFANTALSPYLRSHGWSNSAAAAIESPDRRLVAHFVERSNISVKEYALVLEDKLSGAHRFIPGIQSPVVGAGTFSANNEFVFTLTPTQLTDEANTGSAFYRIRVPQWPTGPRMQLELTGFEGRTEEVPVQVEVWQGGVMRESLLPTLLSGEGFMVASALEGSARLRVRFRSGLWKALNVTLGPNLSGQIVRLLNGDINGDNEIGAADYSVLAATYDRVVSPGTLDPADLNGDGEIGAADFSILAANWGAVGD